MVPTVELPPTMPLTFQVTAGLLALLTVAVNCRDWPTRRLALVGEMLTVTGLAVTATLTAFEVPLVFVTVTGTPLLVVLVLPVAVSMVDELTVVVSDVVPNLTTEPLTKPVPLTVSVKLPVCIDVGLTLVIVG